MEETICNSTDDYMTTDEVATLLVKLYADFQCGTGNYNNETSEKYAKAVGIAIRMLTD